MPSNCSHSYFVPDVFTLITGRGAAGDPVPQRRTAHHSLPRKLRQLHMNFGIILCASEALLTLRQRRGGGRHAG